MSPRWSLSCVAEERDWDLRRLQDIRPSTERTVYGTIIDPLLSLVTSTYHSNAGIGYTRQVVAAMSPRILHCKCVRQLMPHLARRQVVAASVSTYILSQADSEAAGSLENARSREPASEASMVEGIYLALLDCYEESGNVWCHGVAVSGLRPVGMYLSLSCSPAHFYNLFAVRRKLQLLDMNHYGNVEMTATKNSTSNVLNHSGAYAGRGLREFDRTPRLHFTQIIPQTASYTRSSAM